MARRDSLIILTNRGLRFRVMEVLVVGGKATTHLFEILGIEEGILRISPYRGSTI